LIGLIEPRQHILQHTRMNRPILWHLSADIL
jgi:hypothetical protein